MWPEWTSMLAWWQWGLFLAVPPGIILLYFLKLKRRPLVVPSTFLWRRSIEDLHVNSIWQRLRRNLLLFLQLLILALAALSLLRPSWRGNRLSGDRFIFLVDNSASMSATDVEKNRLDAAKREIAGLIDEMKSGDVGMIVSFHDGARVAQSFTDNRRRLKERLQSIEPSARATSVDEALLVASGLANPGRIGTEAQDVQVAEALPATVYIFSDGRFPDVADFSLGNLRPEFRPIGAPDAANVAVTAFDARRNEERPDQLQAFARIENFGDQAVDVAVELYVNEFHGQPADAARVRIPAPGPRQHSGVGGVEFRLGSLSEAKLMLRVVHNDPLPLDNVAYAAINPPREGRVLFVSAGNSPWEKALGTSDARKIAHVVSAGPDILTREEFAREAQAGKYNLIIFDRCQPLVDADPSLPLKKMPQANTLFLGRIPPDGRWKAGERVDLPQVIDTRRSHPLLYLVELGDVQFLDGFPVEPPPGGSSLVDISEGPLFAIAPRGTFEDAVWGIEFEGERDGAMTPLTTWPRRISFPLFVLNVLHYLGGGEEALSTSSIRPGQSIVLRSDMVQDELSVTDPTGRRHSVRRGGLGGFDFSATDVPGIYEVHAAGKLVQRFAVNLFDSAESNLRPRHALAIGHVDVEGKTVMEPARRDAWKVILLAALGVLLFEWYIYNRRVYL